MCNDLQKSIVNKMARTQKEIEVSERLINRIQERFGDRGKFALLEEASGIAATRWKNLFYGKQAATDEQLQFWIKSFPEDEVWLLTGIGDHSSFPFGTSTESASDRSTVGQRLNWVVEEFASPRGNALIEYLSERYGSSVPLSAWKALILRKAEPSVEMIRLICEERPHFAAWVLLGYVPAVSVDPTNESSVSAWKKRRLEELSALMEKASSKKKLSADS